jgi:hypothetical protein
MYSVMILIPIDRAATAEAMVCLLSADGPFVMITITCPAVGLSITLAKTEVRKKRVSAPLMAAERFLVADEPVYCNACMELRSSAFVKWADNVNILLQVLE